MKLIPVLTLFTFMFIQQSCVEEKIVTIEKEKTFNWKPLEAFSHFSKIQLNSHSNEEQLLIMGINTLSQIVPNAAAPDSIRLNVYLLNQTNEVLARLPITDEIFIGASNHTLSLNTSYNLGGITYTKWIDLSDFDSLFADVTSIDAFRGDNIALNNAYQCLVPYTRYIDNTKTVVQSGKNFMFIQYHIEKTGFDSILVDQVDTIRFSPSHGGLFKIASVDEYFFIIYANHTYRVDKDRNVALVYPALINDILKVGDKYVGTGASGLLYSYDKGMTWQKIADEADDAFRYATFDSIDNKIVAFINSQLWECEFSETALELKELDNDGLEGNKITSISEFENKVYVTSLSGVFSKSINEFFQYK